MTPEFVEEKIREEAEKMNLGEELSAYGYEKVEFEILCNAFGELYKRHPKIAREIIRGDLDFYLESVDEN